MLAAYTTASCKLGRIDILAGVVRVRAESGRLHQTRFSMLVVVMLLVELLLVINFVGAFGACPFLTLSKAATDGEMNFHVSKAFDGLLACMTSAYEFDAFGDWFGLILR